MLKTYVLALSLSVVLAPLPGGREDIDVNSQDAQTMAGFAITSLNAQPSRHDVQLVHILKAERQVVSGINYFLELEVTEHGGSKTELCKVTVYDEPWTHTREVTAFICHVQHRRQIPIEVVFSKEGTGSMNVQTAAKAAVRDINNRIDTMYANRLIRVNSAEGHGGLIHDYRLEIVMGQTNCRNVPNIDLTKCPLLDNGSNQTCTVNVHFQPWMYPIYQLVNEYQCH